MGIFDIISYSLEAMMTRLVGQSIHFCISLYGETKVIGKAMPYPTNPTGAYVHDKFPTEEVLSSLHSWPPVPNLT